MAAELSALTAELTLHIQGASNAPAWDKREDTSEIRDRPADIPTSAQAARRTILRDPKVAEGRISSTQGTNTISIDDPESEKAARSCTVGRCYTTVL